MAGQRVPTTEEIMSELNRIQGIGSSVPRSFKGMGNRPSVLEELGRLREIERIKKLAIQREINPRSPATLNAPPQILPTITSSINRDPVMSLGGDAVGPSPDSLKTVEQIVADGAIPESVSPQFAPNPLPSGQTQQPSQIQEETFLDESVRQPTVLSGKGTPDSDKVPPEESGFLDTILGGVRSFTSPIARGAKELFNDPRRMALISGGLRMADPNSYYDAQGFYSPWGGINAGLGTGIKTYKKLSEPTYEEKEKIKAKHRQQTYGQYKVMSDGRVLDITTNKITGVRSPVDLDKQETFFYNKMRKTNPKIIPRDIKYGKVEIPQELFQEYAKMNKMSMYPDTTYKTEYTKQAAKDDADLVTAIDENAETAISMNAELDAQMNILNSPKASETFGPLANWGQNARIYGHAMGLPFVDTGKITSYEMFQKSTMEMLLEQLRKQKGPQTEGDANRALQTLPKADNTILGSKYIIAMKRAINARAVAKQKYMDKYVGDESRGEDVGYPKGLKRAWSKSDIGGRSIFDWMAQTSPKVLVELYNQKVLTGKEIERIVLEME